MKFMKNCGFRTILSASLFAFAISGLMTQTGRANPYASGITGTNASGNVTFHLNEGGGTVTVKYEDSTIAPAPFDGSGAVAAGTYSFSMTNLAGPADTWHTSFTITCYKQGTGNPSLITSDANPYSVWDTPRGVAVNKNPKIGANFGNICIGNANSINVGKGLGLNLLNSDQSVIKTQIFSTIWSAGAGSTQVPNVASGVGNAPYKIRANADGSYLVSDFSTANASLLQFSPDLSTSNLVFSIIGQNAAAAQSIHGDLFGGGIMKGSIAQGNLVLYTFDSGVGAPQDTNCILGPLTSPGSFNCVYRYNIGSGPLPWNKRPDYAYTMGLDGIAELRTEGDVEANGFVICGFGRANLSDPNIQIIRTFVTNGITGDPANGDTIVAGRSTTNWLYTSGVNPPFHQPPVSDPWNGINGSGIQGGTYCGVRVSPDGQFLASVDVNNGVTIATMSGGVPIDGTIFGIANTSSTGNSRGMDWDAANNLWICSSGQGLLRCYSLGQTATCVSSNDWTGTNGDFAILLPAVTASLAIIDPVGSQNYTNNIINPGNPIPARMRITLSAHDTSAFGGPTLVTFNRTGTAAFPANFTINTNETPNGVTVLNNGVIFPAGVFSGTNGGVGGLWNVDVRFTPTATPISGPTFTINIRLNSGTNYNSQAPLSGSMAILNTGPQLLFVSAPAPTTLAGMNRGVPFDQARFNITRWGDTNGPGNDALNVINPNSYIVTNFNYAAPATGPSFKANYATDYTAGPQNLIANTPLSDGQPGITIPPGVVTIPVAIGNPVQHVNTLLVRSNLSVILNLTNVCGPATGCQTNCISQDGKPYQVTTATQTLTEFDNANGGEIVLWSNPLTNSLDSTNWTLVYANILQGGSPTKPYVQSNYDNSSPGPGGGYVASFGKDISTEPGESGVTVPQSAAMAARGWTTALKVSVNKDPLSAGESGVNLYPQVPGDTTGTNFMVFNGNYALRFDMFLSLYDFGVGNPTIGTPAREFAAFGVNHRGTNANWRLDINPRADGTGARPINADGEWCCINAASGSITPADYDMFISPAWVLLDTNGAAIPQPVPFTTNFFIGVPFTNNYISYVGESPAEATNVFANAGVPNDQQSANNNAFGGSPQNGIIKSPPFQGINSLGGAPDNAWIDVSLETVRQTNLVLKVAQQLVFQSSTITPIFGTANPIAPSSGTPMLGYLDPNKNISDYTAFVYFSNMRVVELSPYIPLSNQPIAGLVVTQGSSFTLSSGAIFASNPLTNIWYLAQTNGPLVVASNGIVRGLNRENITPTSPVQTNTYAATNGSSTLTVNNIQGGTNYTCVWSDVAGSVTNLITTIQVISGPGNRVVIAGANTTFPLIATGNYPPTSWQWKFSGTNLVNSTHYGGVAVGNAPTSPTSTLGITNVQPADAGVYSNLVSNPYGSAVPAGTLTVVTAPTPANQTNLWGSTVSFSVTVSGPGSYQWKHAGTNLSNNGIVSGANTNVLTLTGVTTAEAGAYTVGVTNGSVGLVTPAANLVVLVPAPTITNTVVAGGIVTLSFATTNQYDTTNGFVLQSGSILPEVWTNNPNATWTGSAGSFQVTTPTTGNLMFYRLHHVP
jgi:hypothetical protein